jgi:hypothetical protein
MLYSEVIAVCSQIRTKHINTLCGQNVQFVCTFASLLKSTVGLMSVRNGHRTDYRDTWYWLLVHTKHVSKSRLVKIGQNILETEVRLTCIFLGRWIVLGGEEFSEIREKHRNTCFMSNTYFPRNHTACAIWRTRQSQKGLRYWTFDLHAG